MMSTGKLRQEREADMDVISDISLDKGKDATTETICWRVR